MFNTADFLSATFTDQLDTVRIPVPVGDYTGQIGTGEKDVTIDQGVSAKESRPWARLDVNITLADPSGAIKAATGRDPVVTRHGVMLDLSIDGKLDLSPGKNIRLGKLFEAAGWEVDEKKRLKPGFSFGYLKGKPIRVKIGHEANATDPTAQPYERIEAVTRP